MVAKQKLTPRQKREHLFNMYSANLTSCHPKFTDLFVCPICLDGFTRAALDDPPELCLAHCTPKRLRGKLYTLACTRCDNEAGHSVDKQLKNRFEVEDFAIGISSTPRRIWFEINGHRVRCDHFIEKNPDGTIAHKIFVDGDASSPADLEAIQKGLESGAIRVEDTTPTIEFDDIAVDWSASQISLLRCAYLTMFRLLGYGYILNPRLSRVREQILKPKEKIIPGRPIINVVRGEFPRKTECIITQPAELRGFCVNMELTTDSGRTIPIAVIMPGFDPDGDQVFERIAADQVARNSVDVHARSFPPYPGVLAHPKSAEWPAFVWRKYAKVS